MRFDAYRRAAHPVLKLIAPGSSAGVDVAACRAAFELAELHSMAEGWGLSAAGVAAVCAARPPLSRDGLLALGGERARLEAALGSALALADWKTIEREVRTSDAVVFDAMAGRVHHPLCSSTQGASAGAGDGGAGGNRPSA